MTELGEHLTNGEDMTSTTDPHPDLLAEPSARTFPLAQLVSLIREGVVRIPHFQRGLRWRTPDAVALIDSVLRGFPIGSLLLWRRRAPAETIRLGNVEINAPEQSDALYVVDGQQRLTTFLNVFDPRHGLEGEFALVYDLDAQPPKVRSRSRKDSNNNSDSIPLPVLFDLSKLLRWTSEHGKYADRIDEINAATQRLREFHVPAYEVRSQDDGVLREIYDRMNNAGKRLTRAEAFRGLFAPEEGTADATTFETIQADIRDRLQWGQLDLDTVLHAFLARRGPNMYRDIHIEFSKERRRIPEFPDEDREQSHQRTLDALEIAINFLRYKAGVPHFTFLAYRYLLVVLTRFFAHFPDPCARNLNLLQRWYWRAALTGPSMSGGMTGSARALTSCITPKDEDGSVQRLLKAVEGKPHHKPNASNFGANRASGHIMLCALWAREPRSPDTEQPFEPADLALEIDQGSTPQPACPEIFPRSALDPTLASSLGNRLIAPGTPLEARIKLITPETELPAEVRESHFLEASPKPDEPDQFVRTREELLQHYINEFLRARTGEDFDDFPPLRSLDLDEEPAPTGDSW